METDQTPTLAELEMQGMQLIPGEGEPWATRLRPPHPAYISIAAGALVTVTGSRRHAYRIAYTLHDAGLLLDPTKVLPAPIPATVDRDAVVVWRDSNGDLWLNADPPSPNLVQDTEGCIRNRHQVEAEYGPLVPFGYAAPAAEGQWLRDDDWQLLFDIAEIIRVGDGDADDMAKKIWDLFDWCQRATEHAYRRTCARDQVLRDGGWQILAEAAHAATQPPAEDLVERLTVVLHERQCGCPDWGPFGKERMHYRDLARAAIAALREVPRG